MVSYPLVISHSYRKLLLLMRKSTMNIYKWQFSIAMFVYRRVAIENVDFTRGSRTCLSWRARASHLRAAQKTAIIGAGAAPREDV